MQAAEIELKFPVSDLPALEARLPALGFRLLTRRTFEHNTLFDTPDRRLRASRQILRIRRYGDTWTLTHKRVPENGDRTAGRYKTRIETETTLEDGAALGHIFEQLGFAPVFQYEKFRTEWVSDDPHDGHVVLDETPIGIFAEIEGPPEWIDSTISRLGINPSTCLTDSYGKLFLDWKQRTDSPAENLTFDEIRTASVEPASAGR